MKNNKLIAEFMGYEILYRPNSDGFIEMSDTEVCDVSDLEYHFSWNWLMPVVEKCLTSTNDSREFDHHYSQLHDGLWSISIEATYKAVVEFIEWYNKNKMS